MVSIHVNENIQLRSYTAKDAQPLFDAVSYSRQHLHPWLDWVDKTTKPEHSLQFIQQSIHQLNTQEGLTLGIFYDEKIIGGIGMHQWEHNLKRAQVGYWITKEYEGKGIMSVCLEKFADFLFYKTGLNKLEIHFVPANKRSAKLAERLGFKVEGVIRQGFIRNGMPEDLVITGLLKSEWQARS